MVLRQFFLVPFAVRSHPHAKPTTSRRHLLMICAALPRRTRLCAAPATHTSSGFTGSVCQARTSWRLRLLSFLIPIRPTLPVRQPLRPTGSSRIPKSGFLGQGLASVAHDSARKLWGFAKRHSALILFSSLGNMRAGQRGGKPRLHCARATAQNVPRRPRDSWMPYSVSWNWRA